MKKHINEQQNEKKRERGRLFPQSSCIVDTFTTKETFGCFFLVFSSSKFSGANTAATTAIPRRCMCHDIECVHRFFLHRLVALIDPTVLSAGTKSAFTFTFLHNKSTSFWWKCKTRTYILCRELNNGSHGKSVAKTVFRETIGMTLSNHLRFKSISAGFFSPPAASQPALSNVLRSAFSHSLIRLCSASGVGAWWLWKAHGSASSALGKVNS